VAITKKELLVNTNTEQSLAKQLSSMAIEVEEKLKKIMMEKLGLEALELQPEASFTNDLGIDSLDLFELVIEVENVFHINIPSEEAEKLNTPGKIIDYIKNNGEAT
jgi:acyl carrier protein